MSAVDEPTFVRETVRKLLKFPLQYSDEYVPSQNIAASFFPLKAEQKYATKIVVKALGRNEELTFDITQGMVVGDIRKKVIEWCSCSDNDTMRMLIKGKALSDDATKVEELPTYSDSEVLVVNVVLKRAVNLPNEFWSELEVLVDRHDSKNKDDIMNRFRSLFK